jgi:hypothetical protein
MFQKKEKAPHHAGLFLSAIADHAEPTAPSPIASGPNDVIRHGEKRTASDVPGNSTCRLPSRS